MVGEVGLMRCLAPLQRHASTLAVGGVRAIWSSSAATQADPQVDTSDYPAETRDWRDNLGAMRTDWTREEITQVFDAPLLDLVYQAARVHRMYHDPSMVQRCTLLSVKTGGCPENCGYCSQSSHWSKDTGMKAEKLMGLEEVYEWERVLEMVRRIRALGMEVCTTLGMLDHGQAKQLREAGLTAYNHNLDTSPEYYEKITTTRRYEDRLSTLQAVRDAGISVCAGGIIGLGEGEKDRVGLLHQLATLPEHPESVPINMLVAIPGTPLQEQKPPTPLEFVRCVAAARLVMPRSVVRLSAGRIKLSTTDQALCFLAGANSIFDGDKLLTTANNDRDEDMEMFQLLGLRSRPAFLNYPAGGETSCNVESAAVQ